MTEKHDIPEWYIPNEEKVLANDHEKEEIEEEGELDKPLCPYCGSPYLDKTGDSYTHKMVPKEQGSNIMQPGVICVNGEKRYVNGAKHPFEQRTGDEWL
jgi:hypothetical protein